MKLVFDTNIYISAFVIPHSKAEKALLKVVEGKDTLLISKDIINETLTVLSAKFYRDKEALSHLAVYLSEIAQMVEPVGAKLTVLKDEPENRLPQASLRQPIQRAQLARRGGSHGFAGGGGDVSPSNSILECAVSGKADAIVTGDKEMLRLKDFKGIRIMSLREYLDVRGHV